VILSRVRPAPATRAFTALTVSAILTVSAAQPATAAEENRPPATPGWPTVHRVACTDDGILVGTVTPELRVVIDDPDFPLDSVTATLAYWPVDQPTARVEITDEVIWRVPVVRRTVPVDLLDGTTYIFTAKATDQAGANSAWSPECRFTVDTTPPGAPTVTSTES
jgi:hypothetical protein